MTCQASGDSRSRSDAYLFVTVGSHTSSEIRFGGRAVLEPVDRGVGQDRVGRGDDHARDEDVGGEGDEAHEGHVHRQRHDGTVVQVLAAEERVVGRHGEGIAEAREERRERDDEGAVRDAMPRRLCGLDGLAGTLDGSGTLTVDGSLTWIGGSMVGSGTTVIAPTACDPPPTLTTRASREGRSSRISSVTVPAPAMTANSPTATGHCHQAIASIEYAIEHLGAHGRALAGFALHLAKASQECDPLSHPQEAKCALARFLIVCNPSPVVTDR